jgi:hypothetical protein
MTNLSIRVNIGSMARSVRQSVELFHLAFLGELGAKLDRGLYAIKGGCNLRFFFHSVRYSEDLDIDIGKTASGTLRRKVDQILASRSLGLTLGAHGIAIGSVTHPKQTETTQRWKVQLELAEGAAHTKIEFSRRGLNDGVEFGPIDRGLLGGYGLSPMLLSHYGRQAAVEQKVAALVGRSETQARDVFDLDLLLSVQGDLDPNAIDERLRAAAVDRALAVDYRTFKAQVVAFLPPEQQRAYATREAWEQLVLHVVDALQVRS